MPLISKSADRNTGASSRSQRDRRIKELTDGPGIETVPVAGVWPDDPVTALAEWCADTLIGPAGPSAGRCNQWRLPWTTLLDSSAGRSGTMESVRIPAM